MSGRFYWVVWGTAVLSSLMLPTDAGAQRKPWDADRFSRCAKVTTGDLDPLKTIATGPCGEFDKVEKVSGSITNVTVDTVATYSKGEKTGGAWVGLLVLKIGYQRMATVVGGNAAGGFVGYDKLTALIAGRVKEISLMPMKQEVRGCGSTGRGLLNVTTCGYNEYVAIPITDEMMSDLISSDQPSGATLRVKLFGNSGETFEAEIYPAEVIGARKAAIAK